MSEFKYKSSQLHIEGVAISTISKSIPTPFYVYSATMIENNFLSLQSRLSDLNHLICFAVKANSNQAVLRTLAALGSGADVVSLGELKRALHAGVPPHKVVFSGVGKKAHEIEYALEQGILQFNVESVAELHNINKVAIKCNKSANIAIRINPDVAVDTHAKITTGTAENKFGIGYEQALDTFVLADNLPAITVQGIHVHIGSQITDVTPFKAAFKRVADLYKQLNALGIDIKVLDLGGGLGICYDPENDSLPDMAEYRQIIEDELSEFNCQYIVEPGRSLTADTGCLVSEVIYDKLGTDRNFLIVDAAMNDFARPSLYDAYHRISPVLESTKPNKKYDIVGPVCESGDTFAVARELPELESGDLVVIQDCGAYGAVMSGTYNTRPLIAEVMVKNDAFAVIRKRQNLDDLINLDQIPNWLAS
ncbi:diaminopimelate decarboxylase [Psychrosphaera aquimarina]|uniref:Diaminopimelate decarboxylase n=1 Tax=Psychrosphaera aquimarina TaxID=2044854 RepID=A0ABU3R0M4_9GAMM|nr:diaminopimelate decarboxylase [Psychrosphaera aquimarina]MDU0113233.1 diaminopimelate decarboxylase [Psychrosphaera aquimarina]